MEAARDASAREVEVPVRQLRNQTRDVMALVEQGWTVYLTTHGRRFASLQPVSDRAATPRLTALLDRIDAQPPVASGLDDFVRRERDRDRAEAGGDPWR